MTKESKRPRLPAAPKFKATPAPADEAMITEELREGQKAYLLLQLLNAENQTLTRGEANKFRELTAAGKKSINFQKAAVANYRRERLADMDYLKITPGRAIQYTLLPDGRDYLAVCARQLSNVEFRIEGKTLNTLIALARESSFGAAPATAPPDDGATDATEVTEATPAQLAESVLALFEELRRECHSRSGLVPIHEVRQRIAERHGAAAARHDVLDEVILGLWRNQRIALEGISDLGSATEQQLNDSIPGVGNTIFYLEVPRGQPALT